MEKSNVRTINVAIEFLRIGEIDTLTEKYHAEIIIYANWIDNDTIIANQYDHELHWNPKLYVENLLVDQKENIKYFLSYDDSSNRIVNEVRHIKGVFWERLELQNFPLDIQNLGVTVTTNRTLNEVLLINDPLRNSKISPEANNTFIEQQKWKLFKLVKTRVQKVSNDSYNKKELFLNKSPKLRVSTFCSRRPGYYFSNAYFLIFLITISALDTFSIKCKLPQNRLQTTFTLLLTLISLKWVINRSLPAIAYQTSLDKYAIASISYICIICAYHGVIGRVSLNLDTSQEIDEWVFVFFSLILVLIQLYFVNWVIKAYDKIKKLQKEESEYLQKYRNSMDIPIVNDLIITI